VSRMISLNIALDFGDEVERRRLRSVNLCCGKERAQEMFGLQNLVTIALPRAGRDKVPPGGVGGAKHDS
jgi:hypothetical protein